MPVTALGLARARAIASGFFIFGCGPNIQMIYEGNVRFEHCYRLDMDPTIAPPHRRACWQDWLARHAYAQSGDRVSHAKQRLNDLDKGDQATVVLHVDAGHDSSPAEALPLPTNIYDAPPAVAVEPVRAPARAKCSSHGRPHHRQGPIVRMTATIAGLNAQALVKAMTMCRPATQNLTAKGKSTLPRRQAKRSRKMHANTVNECSKLAWFSATSEAD